MPDNIWEPVNSSFVKHYQRQNRDMLVKFHDGKVFRYKDVPDEKIFALNAASSPGQYFKQHISSKHNFEEVKQNASGG